MRYRAAIRLLRERNDVCLINPRCIVRTVVQIDIHAVSFQRTISLNLCIVLLQMLRSVILNTTPPALHQEEAYNPLDDEPAESHQKFHRTRPEISHLIEYLHLKQTCFEAPKFMLRLAVSDGACGCISNIVMATSSVLKFPCLFFDHFD